MARMSARALSFGARAAAYERFRPAYPEEVFAVVAAYAGRPIRTALEFGAGTGKATRLFAAHGVAVTATEPDAAMLAELRDRVPPGARCLRAAFEELPHGDRYDLVYVAAALHWTEPAGRWERVAALLVPGGVFATFGGPFRLADPAVEEAVRVARAPFLDSDEVPPPDGAPPGRPMRWPGPELAAHEAFTDVREEVVELRLTLGAGEFVGLLSTISAYLTLPAADQRRVFARILDVLPPTVEVDGDITVHLARRC
jgi:SAM-dependent methyltransferase